MKSLQMLRKNKNTNHNYWVTTIIVISLFFYYTQSQSSPLNEKMTQQHKQPSLEDQVSIQVVKKKATNLLDSWHEWQSSQREKMNVNHLALSYKHRALLTKILLELEDIQGQHQQTDDKNLVTEFEQFAAESVSHLVKQRLFTLDQQIKQLQHHFNRTIKHSSHQSTAPQQSIILDSQ